MIKKQYVMALALFMLFAIIMITPTEFYVPYDWGDCGDMFKALQSRNAILVVLIPAKVAAGLFFIVGIIACFKESRHLSRIPALSGLLGVFMACVLLHFILSPSRMASSEACSSGVGFAGSGVDYELAGIPNSTMVNC